MVHKLQTVRGEQMPISDEVRRLRSEILKKRWEDPEFRRLMKEKTSAKKRPGHSERMKKFWEIAKDKLAKDGP
jgi:hypothetical protein